MPPGPGSHCRPPTPWALARWGGMFYLFPNYFVLPPVRQRPRSTGCDRTATTPSRARFELWSLTIPAHGDVIPHERVVEGPYAPDDTEHWPRIPLQDFSNIGRQQPGVHSLSFEGLRLSRTYEGGITQMHRPARPLPGLVVG